MTTEELILYYVGLLIVQYTNLPKAEATISAFSGEAIADQIIQQTGDAFDLDTAVGQQLDMIGTYRGTSRDVVGLDLANDFFVNPLYADVVTAVFGYALYADIADPSWYYARYPDSTTALSDGQYRELIEFVAKVQSAFLGLGTIDEILFEFFGTYVTLTDNGDMTITYTNDPSNPDPLFTIAAFLGVLPHPAGVTVNIT